MSVYKYAALEALCGSFRFVRRGNAFFRVAGDGVLQVIKSQRERALQSDLIYIGLFSMYDSLQPQWFTAAGSIARYSVDSCYHQNRHPTVFVLPMDTQISMLQSKVLPWLDTIDTQKALIRAITKLDPRWNDELKVGPYLACGEINHAKKVMREIIGQQEVPETEDVRVWDMINRADKEEIDTYLRNNYIQNLKHLRFRIDP